MEFDYVSVASDVLQIASRKQVPQGSWNRLGNSIARYLKAENPKPRTAERALEESKTVLDRMSTGLTDQQRETLIENVAHLAADNLVNRQTELAARQPLGPTF